MGVSEFSIQDPALPFERTIHPTHGQLYAIYGISPSNAKRFTINFFKNGIHGDTALHIDSRYNEKAVVRNTRRNGAYESEDRSGGRLPLVTGRNFEMMILAKEDCFMIAYNGQHFAEYQHRIPLNEIDKLQITGDIKIMSYEETKPPIDLLESIADSSAESSSIIHLNVKNKEKNFNIPGGIRNDQILHICGVPGDDIFYFDFYPDDKSTEIGFHVSCRVKEDVIVLNSRQGMKWQAEVRPPNFKVYKGNHFDFEITAQDKKFHLLLNGSSLTVFPERQISPDRLTCMKIGGGVTLVNLELVKRKCE